MDGGVSASPSHGLDFSHIVHPATSPRDSLPRAADSPSPITVDSRADARGFSAHTTRGWLSSSPSSKVGGSPQAARNDPPDRLCPSPSTHDPAWVPSTSPPHEEVGQAPSASRGGDFDGDGAGRRTTSSFSIDPDEFASVGNCLAFFGRIFFRLGIHFPTDTNRRPAGLLHRPPPRPSTPRPPPPPPHHFLGVEVADGINVSLASCLGSGAARRGQTTPSPRPDPLGSAQPSSAARGSGWRWRCLTPGVCGGATLVVLFLLVYFAFPAVWSVVMGAPGGAGSDSHPSRACLRGS